MSNLLPNTSAPWKSKGGRVYVVSPADCGKISIFKFDEQLHINMGWRTQDAKNEPAGLQACGNTIEDNDKLHIGSWQPDTCQYQYHCFCMTTDRWLVINDQITTVQPRPSHPWISLSVCGDQGGDIRAVYAGPDYTKTFGFLVPGADDE